MYDTICMEITEAEAGGVNFLHAIPPLLENVGLHEFISGVAFSGWLAGLKITGTENTLKVKEGSLCKFFLGDNYQTLARRDVEGAIASLCDALHLPMDKARVSRLDVATNLIMQHPPDVYFFHLGEMQHLQRMEMPSGLLYGSGSSKEALAFYDKNKEQKAKHQPAPELYKGRNVMRYEYRVMGKFASKYGIPHITAAMLYDEAFYMAAIDRWLQGYRSINK